MGNINQWHECKHGAVYREGEKPVCALCDYSELRARLSALEKHMEGMSAKVIHLWFTQSGDDPVDDWFEKAREILKGE